MVNPKNPKSDEEEKPATEEQVGDKSSDSKTEEQIESETTENFFKDLEDDPDFKEYSAILFLSGKIAADTKPSDLELRQIVADFHAWVEAGKPKPSMPEIPKGKVRIPTAAYRIRDRKSDKMYVYYDDGSVDGKKEQFFMKKITDAETGEVSESDEIDESRKPVMSFDMEFTPEKASHIIEEASKLVPPGKNFAMYFFHKGSKQTISEKNFVKPYEEIAEMLEKKQSID